MQDTRIITAKSVDILWQQIQSEFPEEVLPAEFHVVLEIEDRHIVFDIEENPASTTFSSYLYSRNNFRFAICPQGFIDEIGKFFGMQDVLLGYPDFDEKYIIKTNDESRTAVVFADPSIREVLELIPDLSFGIVEYTLEENEEGKAPFLELKINGSVTELLVLNKLCSAFYKVLLQVES